MPRATTCNGALQIGRRSGSGRAGPSVMLLEPRLALRDDRRRSFALTFTDSGASGYAHCHESRNECDQKLFHQLLPLWCTTLH
jgi:hypothetical protein